MFIKFLIFLTLIKFKYNKADFLVLSDIHYDMYYSEGSPTNCFLGNTGIGCCRKWSIGNGSAPKYGINGCDSPLSLLEIIFDWCKIQNVSRLIFLGDAVDHDLFFQNPEYNLKEIQKVGEFLETLPFPYFSVFGNHDGFIIDNLWDTNYGFEWVRNVSKIYKLPNYNGYYSVYFDNYIALFLNCLLYDTHNIEVDLTKNNNLFNQTSRFLIEVEKLKNEGKNIFIFSHFGSDTGEATDFYNSMISSLNCSTCIYFAGHSHSDEIRLMNDGFFYINPSIVPDSHFPEMRIYKEEKGVIKDYEQYGFNLTSLQIVKVYSAKESYNLKDLSFESWKNFFKNIQTNSTLKKIYDYHSKWGYN